MLWGNAILTALVAMVVDGIRIGFRPFTLITAGIDVFFVFVLAYYLLPWVMYFLLNRMKVRQASVDQVKHDVIVLSGWVALAVLLGLVPWLQPYLYAAAGLWVVIAIFWLVRRTLKAPWVPVAAATLGGSLSVLIVQMLLTSL
ncbi:hypothetical protein [Sulfobacillus harzensis]|uniref:Uncharacterized protein n=1 Tax=Sulfobacillus harzensis TaxID=2729629 RepID=A0A7Y0Q2W9_9FIRM|nr:hypothetical protein [Sulfobacillus harzensis]NMP23598.1 hypothetical protein [Sulfobacillus harzensis]